MPELQRPDVQLYYEIRGQGPPLLLIPGMVSDSATWLPIAPLLEDSFTLICPDNRTVGRTHPWDAPASIDIFAEDCAALLRHLGLGPAHIIGHSMGGLIGMRLALAHPDLTASLTLAATAPLQMARNVDLFRTLLAIRQSGAPEDTWLRALFAWLFPPAVWDAPDVIDEALSAALSYPHAQSADAMAHQIDAFSSYVPDDPARLGCPAMALLAEDDLLVPLKTAQEALGTIPYHVIKEAGHSIHWDAPQETAKHLKEFIEGLTSC